MGIEALVGFLVPPTLEDVSSDGVRGGNMPLEGALHSFVSRLYQRAEAECSIPICFVPDQEGDEKRQHNSTRDEIVSFMLSPTVDRGKPLATRLATNTTARSGTGLLFLAYGQERDVHKLVVSRFPADEGLLAEGTAEGLQVQYLERVFMRGNKRYKAALFADKSPQYEVWTAYAVDRQINLKAADIAKYWIHGFLQCEFLLTSVHGTRLLVDALKSAAKSATDLGVRREIVASMCLAPNFHGQKLSIASFMERCAYSEGARQAIVTDLPHKDLMDGVFELDGLEFERLARYRVVELDGGQILTAPAADFDALFDQELLDETEGTMRFVTSGSVRDERVRTRRQ